MGLRVGSNKINGVKICSESIEGPTLDDYVMNKAPSGNVVLNKATTIKRYFFNGNTLMTSISSNTVNTLNQNVFDACTNLTSISLPNCYRINGSYEFYNCSKLESLFIPNATSAAGLNYTCRYCGFEKFVMPKIKGQPISSNVFRNCTNLKVVDVGQPNQISNADNFNSASNFDTLIIRGLTVCALAAVGTNFSGTPFASGGTGGTLYVPQSLIQSYQSATNWVTILGYENNSIKAIEGSQYENYYADGTPLPTYTGVSFTRDDGKNLNDQGGYAGNVSYFCTNFIETNGYRRYAFVSGVSFNANYSKVQAFNGETFISLAVVVDNPQRKIDDTVLYTWYIYLPEGTTKFRFCGYPKTNLDNNDYALYKEKWNFD